MGEFDRAVRQLLDSELRCPACGAINLQPPASPTLERQQDGSVFCTSCSHSWKPQKEK